MNSKFTSLSASLRNEGILQGGNQNDGSGAPKEFFEGALDEVRLWSRALGGGEVAALAR
jgi:hypothetical protein